MGFGWNNIANDNYKFLSFWMKGGSVNIDMWVFSQQEFMEKLETDWRLVASNISPEGLIQSTVGFEFSFQGMLLKACR